MIMQLTPIVIDHLMSTGTSFPCESVQSLFLDKATGQIQKFGLRTRLAFLIDYKHYIAVLVYTVQQTRTIIYTLSPRLNDSWT